MKQSILFRTISLLLALAILVQPLQPIAARVISKRLLRVWAGQRLMEAEGVAPKEAGSQSIYLPLIITPPGPPDFEIISPADGWTVGGMMYFAAQPRDPETVTSVTFSAGTASLGADNTPADGFQVFFDASTFPAGNLTLTALASGPSGQTSKSITVNVVPDPPSSATIGSQGGVLDSEIGSIITIPPGALPDGTTVTVDELSQDEVTIQNGIDWDAMGVTFLGAQDIQSTAPFSLPYRVASADFGDRVQPGQTVVNYQIVPDADGDGVDEIVVVNTASVAPNNDVISDPIPQVLLGGTATISSGEGSPVRGLGDGLSGTPGNTIEIQTTGLNPLSLQGNVAVWTSLVNGQVMEFYGVLLDPFDNSEQIFSATIPPLPSGEATLVIRNESTGSTTAPINITIEAAPPLSQPATDTFAEFLADTTDYIANLPASTPEEAALVSQAVADMTQAEANFAQLVSEGISPELQQDLNDLALMIENSPVYQVEPGGTRGYTFDAQLIDILGFVGSIAAIAILILTLPKVIPLALAIALTLSYIVLVISAAVFLCRILVGGKCFGDMPPLPLAIVCLPSQAGGGGPAGRELAPTGGGFPTGMGAAPPPGGNGCGNAGGGSGGGLLSRAGQGAGGIVIKIFSAGSPIPFSGVTDPGGYFFIPLIPEGEPFTAIAFDTLTGKTRTLEGVGPPIGESVFMFFDFFSEEDAGASIEFGDVITGEISAPGEIDIYTFSGTNGDRVLLRMAESDDVFTPQVRLYRPDGTELCSIWGARLAHILCALDATGIYTLSATEYGGTNTGSYTLYLQRTNNPANAAPVNFGDTLTGTLSLDAEADSYTFSGTNGDQVLLRMAETAGGAFYPNARLYRPDGTQLCTSSGQSLAHILCALDATGTYTLLTMEANGTENDSYTLYLQRTNNPANAIPVNFGDTLSGTLSLDAEADSYTFSGINGDLVLLRMTDPAGGTLDPQVWLYRPDGTHLCSLWSYILAEIFCTLDATGTYTLLVTEINGTDTGSYGLYLQRINNPGNAIPVNLGDTLTGTITSGVEIDTYTLVGTAGQSVLFRVTRTTDSLDPQFRVYRPDGTLVCNAQTSGMMIEEVCALDMSGSYAILVGDWGGDETGSYEFHNELSP